MCIVRELYCDIFESAKILHAQQWQKTHLKMSFVKYAALLQAHLSLFVIGQKLQTLVMWTRLIITFMWRFNLVDSVTVNDPRWRKYILGIAELVFYKKRNTREGEKHTRAIYADAE